MKHQSLERMTGYKSVEESKKSSGESNEVRRVESTRVHLCNGNSEALAFSLHGEDLSAHLEHSLKALTAFDSVLLEALNGEVLDAVLDLLPTTAEGSDLSRLLEDCARGRTGRRRTVNDGFADGEEIVESHVRAAHRDLLGDRVDVRGFVDLRDILATEERAEPFWCGLLAGDETFGTKNTGGRVYVTRNSVDGKNVGALIVPRAVLAPVCSRHLLP